PKDIRWHFIGHLQTNKVRQIVPFVHLIHSVDSERLLSCINNEAAKAGRRVNVLLEMHVAKEESKTGLTKDELDRLMSDWDMNGGYGNVMVRGVMGMATNTDDEDEWRRCFREISAAGKRVEEKLMRGEKAIVSMGMSEDYEVAIEEGSTMVRVGSKIFGERNY
nr:YggS family pyridoxal phosphate-dependent enzyme [Paludibacteraceae bacterium]